MFIHFGQNEHFREIEAFNHTYGHSNELLRMLQLLKPY